MRRPIYVLCLRGQDSGVASATGNSDLQSLYDLRFEYPKKLLCGYLNNLRVK